jgi:hypothetical protein
MSEDEKVGYGRPPKSGQFKKGQSGNPKGRPKGSMNFRTAIDQALNQRVSATISGRAKSLTKRQVIAHQVVNKAASGELRAIAQLMAHDAQLETREPEQVPFELGADDQAILERYRAQVLSEQDAPSASAQDNNEGTDQP